MISIGTLSRKPLGVLIQIVKDKIFNPHIPDFKEIEKYFENKLGIEIGGPSSYFLEGGFLPIYPIARNVDGCNFSNVTTWEGEIAEGNNYKYAKGKCGYQYICDGVDVPIIPKKKYDFILSCNNLEHIANPLKAVSNWLQLLKGDGALVLVLPRKESNFDHKRSVTSFEHLMNDYKQNIGENDMTHVAEILLKHDLRLDPLAGTSETFKNRTMNNFDNRCLHHHVYDLHLLEEICNFFNLKVVSKISRATDHIIIATT